MTNRKQYVSYNEISSKFKAVSCGVPQGSILGPLLFLLYINDIVTCSKYLYFILFADDTNLLCWHEDIQTLLKIINQELSILADWFKANRLSLNIKKLNYVILDIKEFPGILQMLLGL